MAAKNSGIDFKFVANEAYLARPEIANTMTEIAVKECPIELANYDKKELEDREEALQKAGLRPWFGQGQDKNVPNERPAEGASVATWQDYCNSQGKTYYERTYDLAWFGIKLSSKKTWQGCLTDGEAAVAGAGATTYTPVNPRRAVNCYGSGYSTGGRSYNTRTTCY